MAKNLVADGDKIEITAGGTIAAGAGVLVGAGGTSGGIVGVALNAVVSGQPLVIARKGIWTLPKLNTDVVAVGARLWWDDTNKRLTVTSTSNTFAGWAHKAAGNPSTEVEIILAGGAAA